jgi:hypothetical protein
MDIKSYSEIRESCLLVDYNYYLLGKGGLWIETYENKTHQYRALFNDNLLPITITTHEIS